MRATERQRSEPVQETDAAEHVNRFEDAMEDYARPTVRCDGNQAHLGHVGAANCLTQLQASMPT